MANFPAQRPSESAQAYEAACAYFVMGADRSQEAVSQKLGKSRQIISRWSAQHDWVERTRTYDADVAQDIAQEHTRRYLAELEDHRKRYADAGRGLYTVAGKLLKRLDTNIVGLEVTPATLGILLRAFTTAADLEAHALGLDKLMPSLTDDSE